MEIILRDDLKEVLEEILFELRDIKSALFELYEVDMSTVDTPDYTEDEQDDESVESPEETPVEPLHSDPEADQDL